tara:strand:- start:284 stop:619 length:336 start_codon:yes stop_codon:yes gene_type:complete
MNSKSDIIDELNTLRNHNTKKTKTLDDIIAKNVQNIESVIDSKVINIYARPWVRLEPKLKLKKINEYLSLEENIFEDGVKEKILKYFNDKKKVVVKYDVELCSITNLKTSF